MKNNLIVGILVGLLSLGALITLILSFRVITASRELANHRAAVARINHDRVPAQILLNELEAYSKTNVSVRQLLTQLRSNTNRTINASSHQNHE